METIKMLFKTIILKLKGKSPKEAEHKQGSNEDFAPTKRYQITTETKPIRRVDSYLIAPSECFLLEPGFMVGRGMSCHLRLTDPSISRVHASFDMQGEKWLLKDNSSKNGTFVNGVPVHSATLKNGDKIQIGETLLTYEER